MSAALPVAPPVIAKEKPVYRLLVTAAVLLVLSIVGVLLATVVSPNLESQLTQGLVSNFVLNNAQASAYPSWASSDDPNAAVVFSTYFIYNISNPNDVLGGAKPALVELPGLTYSYRSYKLNISWDAEDSGDIVSFRQYQLYVAANSDTLALERTEVVSLNLPLLSVISDSFLASLVISNPFLASKYAGNASSLFIRRTAREILWGWSDDEFLSDFNAALGWSLPTNFPGLQGNDTSLAKALATHSPIRMRTGVRNPSEMMQYVSWGGDVQMRCCEFGPCGDAGSGDFVGLPWSSIDANAVSGSQGGQFKVGVSSADVLRVATYDFGMYRHWDMSYGALPPDPTPPGGGPNGPNGPLPPPPPGPGPTGSPVASPTANAYDAGSSSSSSRIGGGSSSDGSLAQVQRAVAESGTADAGDGDVADYDGSSDYSVQGIDLLRFTLPLPTLDNATANPVDGVAYHQFGPNGLLNQSSCEAGAPIFLSKPR